jgi:Mrp family chromosome partitioning ATPase
MIRSSGTVVEMDQLAEHYAHLAAQLRRPGALWPAALRQVGVTACSPREGVSTAAAQLALAAARQGEEPVLLIDAHPADASVHRSFAVPRRPGLLEVLAGDLPLSEAIHDSATPRLRVLSAGGAELAPRVGEVAAPAPGSDAAAASFGETATPHSSAAGTPPEGAAIPAGNNPATPATGRVEFDPIDPEALRDLLATAGAEHRLVVVDLPPISDLATCGLAATLEGVLLVVEAERVHSHVARRGKTLLEQAGARLLGIVFNKREQHIPSWLYRNW